MEAELLEEPPWPEGRPAIILRVPRLAPFPLGLGLLVILVTACTPPPAAPTPASTAIFAAQLSVSPAATIPPTLTPQMSSTLPPRPTAGASCTNNASFIEDLTIPDATQVLPGESLDKRWSVSNTGSCDWGPDYRLAQIGSSEIEGPAEVALYPAKAGSTAVWQVALVAPTFPGEYLARWQARAPDGTLFGEEVFVLILVAEPEPTGTPSVTPTP